MADPDRWYWYEHVSGEIIRKPAIVIDMGGGPKEYFDSPFVKRWGTEEDDPDREADG